MPVLPRWCDGCLALLLGDAGISTGNPNIGSAIFRVEIADVPEPATLGLLGVGLFGMRAVARRARHALAD